MVVVYLARPVCVSRLNLTFYGDGSYLTDKTGCQSLKAQSSRS